MAKYFKRLFVPNADGTDSATAITNANTVFFHTYIGDDFTGDGTREYPYKSAFKANQKSGVTFIVFRGVVNELFSTSKTIIGDDINQIIILTNYSSTVQKKIYSCTMDTIAVAGYDATLFNVIVLNDDNLGMFGYLQTTNTCFKNKLFYVTNGVMNTIGNTIGKLYPNTPQTRATLKNNIVIKEFCSSDMSSNSYCLFLSTCIFKHNNINIIQPIWSLDSKANVQLLRNAYLSAGISQIIIDALFVKDSFGNETCRIVKEERNGGTSANIFNAYNTDGTVLDYSLNPQSNNEALYASDLGGYVGCFKPASAMVNTMWNTPIDVNVDGTDTVNLGALLRVNSDQSIDFNTDSAQIWNRIKSNTVLAIPNGIKFNGIGTSSVDGSAFGYYFGKHQNLMNGTALTPADVLEANSIYKVCNINRDIYSAVVFNGTQYLPDYFFKTGTSVLNFTLLNTGSGTVVKKVLATPLESVEIIPYDDLTTPSAFPKFSCPLAGNVMMLFHKIGINIDKPVLFSEVTNDKIAYYSSWAVTNADQEFVTLASDTVNYYYKIPVLKFLLPVLNAHFNADYDQ